MHEQEALNLLADVVEHGDRDSLTLQARSGKLDEASLEVIAGDQEKVGEEDHDGHLSRGGGHPARGDLDRLRRTHGPFGFACDGPGTHPFAEPTSRSRHGGGRVADVGANGVEDGRSARNQRREQ